MYRTHRSIRPPEMTTDVAVEVDFLDEEERKRGEVKGCGSGLSIVYRRMDASADALLKAREEGLMRLKKEWEEGRKEKKKKAKTAPFLAT